MAMEPLKSTLLLARWACSMDGPIIRDGGVAVIGDRISAVGPATDLKKAYANAEIVDYGSAALLPGLINPHTHLDLTNRPRIEFDGDITGWLLRQRPPMDLTPEQRRTEVEAATHAGIVQCLQYGVTSVGDISQQTQWTRPILARSPLRAISFGEVLGLGKLRARTKAMREQAADQSHATARVRSGISPHSPYTLEWPQINECASDAVALKLPLSLHLAEWLAERDFLATESGPFREMWEKLKLWDDQVQILHKAPILLAVAARLLQQQALLVHVNYLSDIELEFLAAGNASVIFCPRTHAYFRHPPHRWRDMLLTGVNVAVGTDSCASSPNLNIVDDLRLLRQQYPTEPPQLLWSLVTTRAARAMKMADDVGSLTPSKFADVTAFPATNDEPLELILQSSVTPIATWIGGECVYSRET